MAARFDPHTGALSKIGVVAQIERPTWLTPSLNNKVLYSVSEVGNVGNAHASVFAFSVDAATGQLSKLSQVDSGGGGATYLSLAGGPSLLVANYGTGQVSVLPIQPDGSLLSAASIQTDYGTGPTPRQSSPHAHGAVMDKSGKFVLATDLGADRIFIYRFDAATRQLKPSDPPFVTAPPGSGPRHLVLSPSGRFVYALFEMGSEIATYEWNSKSGILKPLNIMSTLPADSTGEKSAGEILLSPDGRYLYVSNRVESTIVAYAVNTKTGGLKQIQRIASGGAQPWSISIDPSGRWMVVANEPSGLVTVFSHDPKSGLLSPTDSTLPVAHASSVAFMPN